MDIIRIKNTFKGQDGKEVSYYEFSIRLDNGNYVAVKPVYRNDKRVLFALSKDID